VFPSSTAVWHDCYYHVDFVIIGPEKTDPVWVDVKHLFKLKHCVMSWAGRMI